MKNRIYENNLELFKELEGFTIEEIRRKSIENYHTYSYDEIIKAAFGLSCFFKAQNFGNLIHIDRHSVIRMYIDKFSLNLNDYCIEYNKCAYKSEKDAIEHIEFTWLREQLLKERFGIK